MHKRALAVAALIAMLAAAFPAQAQDNGALVWTGGIGTEERDAAPKEGTKLVFFVATGNFLSDVHVIVKDAGGKEVVNATSKGPWMILKLAPGRYSVHAAVGGQEQGGTIDVSAGNQEFAYMFKAR